MSLPSVFQLIFLFAFVLTVFLTIRRPQRFGIDPNDPFYPWKRWTWKAMPPNWKSKLLQLLFWLAAFALVAAYALFKQRGWVAVFSAMMSVNFAAHAVRIVVKRINLGSLGGADFERSGR